MVGKELGGDLIDTRDGDEFFKQGNYEAALVCYDKQLKCNDDDFFLWNNKGLTLLKLGQIIEARKCSEKIKEIHNKSIQNHQRLNEIQNEVQIEDPKQFCLEHLPYPIVHYPGFERIFFSSQHLDPNSPFEFYPPLDPGHPGTAIFLGFRSEKNSPIYLCSCSKRAIMNYIRFKIINLSPSYGINSIIDFILSPENFPIALIDELLERGYLNSEEIIEKINFKVNLCHECNNIPPPDYKYPRYRPSNRFYEKWGWYVEKQRLEFGIQFNGPLLRNKFGYPDYKGPYSLQVIRTECPDTILSFLKSNEFEVINKEYDIFNYIIDKHEGKEIRHIIENAVRNKLGHKNIGEKWTNETDLYYIVKSLYPDLKIIPHYTPDFLEGMEIDIFIKELNLGIEYQGIQHFQPMKHWGGNESFEKLKARDELKRTLCRDNGIRLVFINHDEEVSESLVKSKMSE